MPSGPFDLILCRYLAFTYFAQDLQREVAANLRKRLVPGGFVVLGKRESWPAEVPGATQIHKSLPIYRTQ